MNNKTVQKIGSKFLYLFNLETYIHIFPPLFCQLFSVWNDCRKNYPSPYTVKLFRNGNKHEPMHLVIFKNIFLSTTCCLRILFGLKEECVPIFLVGLFIESALLTWNI